MLAAAPYAQKVREMVAVLAAHVGELQHPLLRPPTVENSAKRILLLVVTSTRGLVGAYNNVLRMASDFIRRREAENYSRRGSRHMKERRRILCITRASARAAVRSSG